MREDSHLTMTATFNTIIDLLLTRYQLIAPQGLPISGRMFRAELGHRLENAGELINVDRIG